MTTATQATQVKNGTQFRVQTTNGPVVKEIYQVGRFGYKARNAGQEHDELAVGFDWYGREYFLQAVKDGAIEIL